MDRWGKSMNTQGYHCNVYALPTHENLEADCHKMLNIHDEIFTSMAYSFLRKIQAPHESYYWSNLEQEIIA